MKTKDWQNIRKAQVVDANGSRLVVFVCFSTLHEAALFNKEKFFIEGQQMVFADSVNPWQWITTRQVRVYTVPIGATYSDVEVAFCRQFFPVPTPQFSMRILPLVTPTSTRILMFDSPETTKKALKSPFIYIGSQQCAVTEGSYDLQFWSPRHSGCFDWYCTWYLQRRY